MSRLRALGLRTRLALALVTIALLAVGLATLLSHQGIHPRLEDAARARLARSAAQVATEARDLYTRDGGWTQSELHGLEHLALVNRLELRILRLDGSPVALSESDAAELPPPDGEPSVSRPIVYKGARVGTVIVTPVGGNPLTPEESELESSLNRLHLVAGAISIAAALVLAFVMALTLSRPLRRIREGANQIAAGDLATRVDPSGGAELAAVADALNQLAETLDREEELRRENVGNVAHEFRTPVSGILSRIEAAQDGVLADDAENLAAMHAEVLRLTRLLDDLSRLAEAQQPDLLLHRRLVHLAEVASTSADGFAPAFADKGIELILDLEPAALRGDPDRLTQVVSNLLSNALHYTESGGCVEVETRRLGDQVILEVRDTGIGIAAEDQDRIFERFWRAEKSRSRATGGAGIGLAIVRELVRAHGGTIEVLSAPGRGSRFRVSLPARVPEQATRRSGKRAVTSTVR